MIKNLSLWQSGDQISSLSENLVGFLESLSGSVTSYFPHGCCQKICYELEWPSFNGVVFHKLGLDCIFSHLPLDICLFSFLFSVQSRIAQSSFSLIVNIEEDTVNLSELIGIVKKQGFSAFVHGRSIDPYSVSLKVAGSGHVTFKIHENAQSAQL